jgi:hypothetical protein
MEAQPGIPVRRAPEPDVVVASNSRVSTFHPMSIRAQLWLARNVPPNYHANGHVVTGKLRAAQLMLWMALEGFVVG